MLDKKTTHMCLLPVDVDFYTVLRTTLTKSQIFICRNLYEGATLQIHANYAWFFSISFSLCIKNNFYTESRTLSKSRYGWDIKF